MALDSMTPAMPAPVRRHVDAPVRPGVMTAPSEAATPKEAVRGSAVAEVIAQEIKNVTQGRMMVGAWQTYQQATHQSAPVRESGNVVPPLPVRLLNLALNVTQAGRRLDAPLLDGAVTAQPGQITAQPQPTTAAPTADQPTLQPRPDNVPNLPTTPAPSFPATAEDEGGRVPQSPIDPVSAKASRPVPVGIPADAPVAPDATGAFEALVTGETDDLDILADWPEEEAIDDEVWPDEVSPEAAAEFLTALGNVVAGQNAQAAATPADPAEAPVTAPRQERSRGVLPGPLPLQDHMEAFQANTLVSGTSTDAPDTQTGVPAPVITPAAAPAPAVAAATPVPAPVSRPAAQPVVAGAVPQPAQAPVAEDAAPATTPVRPESRRAAPARRAVEPTRVRVDAADADLPVGLIPREMVQAVPPETSAAEPPAVAAVAAGDSRSGGDSGGNGDTPPDQRRNPEAPAAAAPTGMPTGFVNPMAFTPQATPTAEPGVADEGLSIDAAAQRSRVATPAAESDPIGPVTVRSAEVAASRTPEAAARPAEPQPMAAAAAMSSQQLIDAVNDGVPVHFAQFPNLVEGLVASKPFVDKTVDVVLQPENLGRIRLQVSLVEGGTAIKIAIATQSVAAQQVFESYGSRMQQIAQSQGYTLKEFDVKISDRPIRSEGRGNGGNDAAGQRQGRRKRRGRNDDSTV
jgi:hypothetical protein